MQRDLRDYDRKSCANTEALQFHARAQHFVARQTTLSSRFTRRQQHKKKLRSAETDVRLRLRCPSRALSQQQKNHQLFSGMDFYLLSSHWPWTLSHLAVSLDDDVAGFCGKMENLLIAEMKSKNKQHNHVQVEYFQFEYSRTHARTYTLAYIYIFVSKPRGKF